jgi:hypothetical protein
MAGEGTGEGTGTGAGTGAGTGQGNEPAAWLAQLPADLKANEAFTGFKTLGDLAKAHLDLKGKAAEADGKLKGAIFKPGEKATPEEKAAYAKAMGIPDKPTEYDFPKGEGVEHDPKMIEWAGTVFHQAGLSKEQGALISKAWDGFIQGIAQGQQQAAEAAKTQATEALKKEWGADFDKNIEFTKRGWKKFSDADFDKFAEETGIGNHPALIKFIFKIGQAMGEDWSPQGSQQRGSTPKEGFIYDKSPAPPAKS